MIYRKIIRAEQVKFGHTIQESMDNVQAVMDKQGITDKTLLGIERKEKEGAIYIYHWHLEKVRKECRTCMYGNKIGVPENLVCLTCNVYDTHYSTVKWQPGEGIYVD